MSAQTTYSQSTPRGAAGGLYDLSGHAVNTRINAETGLTMKFGLGVVQGSVPGSEIKLPAAGATADKFEGITVNGYTNEMNSEGAVFISPAPLSASFSTARFGPASSLKMLPPTVTSCTSSSLAPTPASSPRPPAPMPSKSLAASSAGRGPATWPRGAVLPGRRCFRLRWWCHFLG